MPVDGSETHTYGPGCRLAPVSYPEPAEGLEGIPPINAQFFYSSPIPIDDPLAASTIIGANESKSARAPLRPFSAGDNTALERAWLDFASDRDRRNHHQAQRNRSPSPSLSKENAAKVAAIVAKLSVKHKEKHDREGQSPLAGVVCCQELTIDASAELRKEFCAVTRRRQRSLDHDVVVQGVMAQLKRLRSSSDATQPGPAGKTGGIPLGTSPASRHISTVDSRPSTASGDGELPLLAAPISNARPPVVDDGISGKPFIRVEPSQRSPNTTPEDRSARLVSEGRQRSDSKASRPVLAEAASKDAESVEIPVGISRLHNVSLPVLQMKPIYWSPVNDIAIVMRATWFYR